MGDQESKMRKEIKSAKAKHGLSKKKKNGVRAISLSIFERPNRRERERGEEKREEEEEKRRREKKKQSQKGMELHGILKFCMNFHAWMVIICLQT